MTITPDPGNSFSTAFNIGALSSDQTFTEFVCTTDRIDFYKFSLASTNDITLLLNGLTQFGLFAKIYYDKNNDGLIDNGDELYSTRVDANQTGKITTTLGAGNYFVGISQATNETNTNYTLQLLSKSAPPSIASNPGNSFGTAFNIGYLTGTKTFTEFVGTVDTVDYYKFSLVGSNDISLQLSGLTQFGLFAKIYSDKNNNGLIDSGDELNSTRVDANQTGKITATLGAGNYFVEISQATNETNTNYSLTLVNITNPNPLPPLSTPIRRFQNTNVPGTYLFAGEEEAANIRTKFKNFKEEGLAFQVGVEKSDPLMQPMYRFQNSSKAGTYLFAGEEEAANIRSNFKNFKEEGIAFYVFGVGSGQGTTYNRFQNTSMPGTYLFAGPEETVSILANNKNFVLEGKAFEVG